MDQDGLIVSADKIMNEHQIEFLNQECGRMLELYTQAQESAQSVFNFYLSFVTAVLGAVLVILQVDPLGQADAQSEWVLGAVLFFGVIVGSVYLSALSGRYGYAARYALAVDVIRRHLITKLDVPMPTLYQPFLDSEASVHQPEAWYLWLLPTGTYQMFIAVVNSTALAAVVWLIFTATDAGVGRAVIASLLVFVITLSIFNAYSRMVIDRFRQGLNIYMWEESPAWASRG